MKRHYFLMTAALAAVMLIGPAFLSVSEGNEQASEKSLEAQPPVCFNIRLPYTVNQKISQKLQADNKMLLALLDQLKSMPLDNDKNIAKAAQMLQGELVKTYLNRPRLIMDDAKMPYEGWKAIVRALKDIVKKDTEFCIPSLEVQGFYVPSAGAREPEMDTDLKMLIRATVIIGSRNDILEGCLLHRRTCTPLACEE